VGKAAAFLTLGQAALPAVNDRLSRLRPFLGTEDETWATLQAYEGLPKVNFSEAVLQPCAARLAVADLPHVTWSDLGTPRRVIDILKRSRAMPSWVLPSDLAAS